MTHRKPILAYGLLIIALSGFSGTFSSGNSGDKNRPVTTGLSRVEEIYAPFDTLLTDLKDYIWPTNASTIITSSFADYRLTHLHEGVDISTNNQNGYPVYASRKGYVSRIFISRRGYGKMLYVRHPDGFVTMYAHLQRFNAAIDAYAKKLQKESKRYSLEVDIDPAIFPVEKGDLIAYTGETGTGGSHLHFEVRDSALNPINPFLLPQVSAAISDQVPPRFGRIAFTPLARGSKAQGRTRTWVVDAKRKNAREFVLVDPVKVSGVIGVSVNVTDQADDLKYKTGAYRFEVYVDGKLVFTSAKKFILESEAHQVMAYYDRNLLWARKGRFEKLYVEHGNRLPFYNRLPEGTGPIDTSELEPGEHQLRIVTWDLSSNASSLTAVLIVSASAKH